MIAALLLAATLGNAPLGGLLPVDGRRLESWPACGAWRMPVGDPYREPTRERPTTPGAFQLLRGPEGNGQRLTHEGADLGNGSSGAPVRAAAAGLVVRAVSRGQHGGFGAHVVLAHRLPGGQLVYTVYAHLRSGSLRVRDGDGVAAGTVLAAVGATGRASTPHLHFEVRTPDDPSVRWENAAVVDPVPFVLERLPVHRDLDDPEGHCLEWAEFAGLVSPGAQPGDALTGEAWWRMLAASVQGPWLDPELTGEAMRDLLAAAELVDPFEPLERAGRPLPWDGFARGLERLAERGLRTGTGPLDAAALARRLESRFGDRDPLRDEHALRRRGGSPTIGEAVLMIAALAGPRADERLEKRHVPPKRTKPSRHRRRTRSRS